MDPEEYADFLESTSGSYSGVGMTVQMKDRLVTVVSVFEGTPAANAGIQAGDIVVSVDGVSTTGQTLDEVVAGIKGPEGTTVVLEMYRRPGRRLHYHHDGGGDTTGTTEAETTDETRAHGGPYRRAAGRRRDDHASTRSPARPSPSRSPRGRPSTRPARRCALISLYTFTGTAADDLRAEVSRARRSRTRRTPSSSTCAATEAGCSTRRSTWPASSSRAG